MKRFLVLLSLLAISSVVMGGCSEKKPAEKAPEPAMVEEKKEAPAVEQKAEAPAEQKAVVTPEPKPAAVAEKKPAAPVEEVKTAAMEVKKEAEKVVAAAEKTATAVKKTEAAPAMPAVDAGRLFKAKCAACHGIEGQGTAIAPAFKGNAWVKESPAADIAATIRDGREGAAKRYRNFPLGMPAQKGLTDGDLASLVEHLKSMASK